MNDHQLAQQLKQLWSDTYKDLWSEKGPLQSLLADQNVFKEFYNSDAKYQVVENSLTDFQKETLQKALESDASFLNNLYGYEIGQLRVEAGDDYDGEKTTYAFLNTNFYDKIYEYLEKESLSIQEKKFKFILEISHNFNTVLNYVANSENEINSLMYFAKGMDLDTRGALSLGDIMMQIMAQLEGLNNLKNKFTDSIFDKIWQEIDKVINEIKLTTEVYQAEGWLELRKIFADRNYNSFISDQQLQSLNLSVGKKGEWQLLQGSIFQEKLQGVAESFYRNIENKGEKAAPSEKAWATAYELTHFAQKKNLNENKHASHHEVEIVIDDAAKIDLTKLHQKNYGKLTGCVQTTISEIAKVKGTSFKPPKQDRKVVKKVEVNQEVKLEKPKSFWKKYKTPIIWAGAILAAAAIGAASPYIFLGVGISLAALTATFVSLAVVSIVLGAAAAVVSSLTILGGWGVKRAVSSAVSKKENLSTSAKLLANESLGQQKIQRRDVSRLQQTKPLSLLNWLTRRGSAVPANNGSSPQPTSSPIMEHR